MMTSTDHDNQSVKAALAAFDQVQKEQRTQLFKEAIAELELLESQGLRLPPTVPEWFPELTGEKIALFIGINDYSGLIPDLNTPNHDVTVLNGVLEQRGFQGIVLKNATYEEVMGAFRGIAERIKPGQDLIVYYAGHGYLREDNGRAYWIMGDARADSAKKWVSTRHIGDFLAKVAAKNTMLISDSCYSGALTKANALQSGATQRSDAATMDRLLVTISSGGEEPVADGGSDGHSIFAFNLIKQLRENPGEIKGFNLFSKVRDGVTELFPQTPQYDAITTAESNVSRYFHFNSSR